MSQPDHARIKEIFFRAIDLTEDQRDAFLHEVCGSDDELRAAVETLLLHHNSRTILSESRPALPTRSAIPRKRAAGSGPPGRRWERFVRLLESPTGWLLVILLALILMSGIGFWTHRTIRRSIREMVGGHLQALLDANALALQEWVEQNQRETEAWARGSRLKEWVGQLQQVSRTATDPATALRNAPAQQQLLDYLRPYLNEPDSAAVAVTDAQGIVLATNVVERVGWKMDDPARQQIERVFQGEGHQFHGPVQAGVVSERPTVWFHVAVRDNSHQVIAALSFAKLAELNFADIFAVAQMGTSGETYAFDRQGTMLSESRFTDDLKREGFLENDRGARSMLNIQVRDPRAAPDAEGRQPLTRLAAAATAASGRESASEQISEPYRNYLGRQVIGAWRWKKPYRLGMATEIEVQEADEPAGFVIIAFLVLLSVLGVAVAVLSASSCWILRLRRQIGEVMQLGQYTLVQLIGEGGIGKVFLARHAMLKRPTAIKILNKKYQASEVAVTRFEREVQLASQLTHPNTIEIYDFGRTDEGIFYYAMEYVPGPTLAELIRRESPIPVGRAIHILRQTCDSLRETHSHGLIHRDVKPQNIKLCCRGGYFDVVKVLDFGLVKHVESGSSLTARNQIIGTPMYMAPERFHDPGQADQRIDIYAVGAVAYELLSGEMIFPLGDQVAVIEHVLNRPPIPLAERLGSEVPDELEQLIMACLAKDPEQRPTTMAEIVRRLEALAERFPWSQEDATSCWQDAPTLIPGEAFKGARG